MYFKISLVVIAALAFTAQAAQPLAGIDEINKALAAAQPGDTVVIKDGIYRDAAIVMPASGEKDKPIALTAQTPGKVVFTGDKPHPSSAIITLAGSYQVLSGVVFQKSTGGPAVWFKKATFGRMTDCAFNESGESRTTFTHMIEMGDDSADNRVDHCYMAKSLSISIGLRAGAVHCRFDHNWWRDIVSRSTNGQEALQLLAFNDIDKPEHSLFATVEYNLFDGACGDEEIISVKSNDNVIRYNTFLPHPTANKGGVNIRHGHRNVVDSNHFLGTDYGVRISGSENIVINNDIQHVRNGLRLTAGGTNGWGYMPAHNGLFANNTIDASETAIEIATYFGMKDEKGSGNVVNIYPTGNRIYNNILTCAKPNQIVFDRGNQPEGNQFKTNLGFSSKAKSEAEMKLPDGVVAVDPKLATDAQRHGTAVEQVKFDIAGRPRGATPTVGCEETTANEAARIVPVGPKDVGPTWINGDATMLDKEAGILQLNDLLKQYPDPDYRARLRETLDAAK